MIHVVPASVPAGFDEKVRDPGLRALAEMVGEPPPKPRTKGRPFKKIADRREDIPSEELPTYWTKALDDLMAAYQRICAYACFRIHPITGARSADHMVPKSRAWNRVYDPPFPDARERDWSNYIEGRVSFQTLLEESPFVARELLRQGRLHPGDAPAARVDR